jgi:hypothetical protein
LVVFMRNLACASSTPGVFDDALIMSSEGYVEERSAFVLEPEEEYR